MYFARVTDLRGLANLLSVVSISISCLNILYLSYFTLSRVYDFGIVMLCKQETKRATSMLMGFFKSFTGLNNRMDPGSLGIMSVKVAVDAIGVIASWQLMGILITTDNEI